MSLTTLAIITLCLSAAVICAAIILSICLYIKNRRDEDGSPLLSPLQTFTICFFAAVAIMLFPVHYSIDDGGFWVFVKSVLVSVQNALQVFTVNAEFDAVQNMTGAIGDAVLSKTYAVYASVMFVISPALTAGFILSLFKETSAFIKYSLYPRADIYLMSELNERSVTLAENIKKDPAKGRRIIVFAGVNRGETPSDLINKAKKLGAIIFRRDVTRISLKPTRRGILRKFYLLSEDEDGNTRKALDLIDRLKKRYDNEKTELYVFARSTESEALLSSAETGAMKVRRVNENRNLAWKTLREVSIFDNPYIPAGSTEKLLNIVIVGCGQYGTELIKTICWLGQMPGYSLSVHVFDKDSNCEGRVKCVAPELVKRSGIIEDGEANYSLYFYPDTDINSSVFLDKLDTVGKITSVFVTLGSDSVNIDTAIKIRCKLMKDKKYRDSQPPIYPVVYNESRSATAERGNELIKNIKNEQDEKKKAQLELSANYNIGKYNLHFIGNITDCYSVENVEQKTLEEDAIDYHLCWAKSSDAVEEDKFRFNKFEYYRSSSMAQAMYIDYLKKLGPIQEMIFEEKNKVLFNEYEHRRWNAYMRAEGYVYSDKKDNLAKIHYDLKPFDELSDKEKQKDEVWMVALKK